MVRSRAHRSLATVLFVDIVDSTRVASDVGDRRWRELLGSFRRAMRRRLRAEHGQEQDTAGDGFFATFDRPASAIRAAVGLLGDIHAVGLDARCGIHTGELERIDGRLGGIAAHIGARVMAHAGPAEILVTGTVHDLVVGSGVTFDDPRAVELKGVPGRWTLYRVAAVDGVPNAAALAAEDARVRLSVWPSLARRPSRAQKGVVLGMGAVGVVVVVALGAVIPNFDSQSPSLAGAPTSAPQPDRPPTMVKIDAATNQVELVVTDKYLPVWTFPALHIIDGVLWQDAKIAMVRRDVGTGEVLSILEERANAYGAYPAFGSLWLDAGTGPDGSDHTVIRIDPISGRELAVITIDEPPRWISIGRDGFYILTTDEILYLDPDANAIADRDPHGLGTIPDSITAVGGQVWICECDEGRITEWDVESDTAIRTVEFAQRGFFLDDQRELSQGVVSADSAVVWLMDDESGTITPVDTATGDAGQPIGIPRESGWHVFGLGSIWIGAKNVVVRIDLETRRETSIQLPDGVHAGGLAIDEPTNALWVANHVPVGEPIPKPLPDPSTVP